MIWSSRGRVELHVMSLSPLGLKIQYTTSIDVLSWVQVYDSRLDSAAIFIVPVSSVSYPFTGHNS
jgi:hypothetical protein